MKQTISIVFVFLIFQGCVQTIAIRSMGGIMDYGFEAFNEEPDLQLAQEALGSNLKLIEALIKADPDNEKLLLLASQGYSAYALAFAEDDSVERARAFYLRGRDYAIRILAENPTLKKGLDSDLESFRRALATLSTDDVPVVFWVAFGWGGYINITRSEVSALADLPKVNAMMEFVIQHDPGYYYGGAHLFLGAIDGTFPPALGGNPARAKEHFEKAISLNGGKFLMTYVYYARTYAIQTLDQELFESLLNKVEETSLDVLPEARLANAVAKKKANLLREKMGEIF